MRQCDFDAAETAAREFVEETGLVAADKFTNLYHHIRTNPDVCVYLHSVDR